MNTGIISRMKKSLSLVKCQGSNVKGSSTGFTLLELLIVVAIIAILSVALILVINPAETLKKSRDAQRISDMATLKTALGLLLTSSSTPYLSGVGSNAGCLQGTAATKVYYSAINVGAACGSGPTPAGASANGTFTTASWCSSKGSVDTAVAVDGNGWLPVDFSWLPGGSPISNLPLDPINTVAAAVPAVTDLTYRYVCQSTGTGGAKPSNVFEIDAILESDAYKAGGTDDKPAKDGGDNTAYYEVGTNLKLINGGM